jgi:uncharacterized protein YbjT (DUF2867 family)
MPVLVIAPHDEVAEILVRRIAATGGEVRAYGPDLAAAELRSLGVICAHGVLVDEGHLETAMEQVHTVIHLGFDAFGGDPHRLVEEAATIVAAAIGAGVRRLVAVTLPEPGAEAGDPVRVAAAEVEELISSAPLPTVIVRPSLLDAAASLHLLARTPVGREALDSPVAPVRPADLAELLFRLDEQRDAIDAEHVVLAADGPRAVPLGEHLRARGITPLSVVGRLVERLRPGGSTLPGVLDGPWTSAPEVLSGWEATGVTPAAPDEPV